ncbi:hypothetical protein [Peribacillus asahii]|uniref:hypothetical protein n=1 Tax=Peribacillus asahii TaxID=228899 RepID=UPI00207A2A10|nr:hypothetical protein [Peribacillus asahii]USK58247.1 hypothetical protein LIT37_13335 [Peribacillus asahii]
MNKKVILTGILTGIMTLFLTACGSNNMWEGEEKTIEMSDRIITEDVEVGWELDNNQASGKGTQIRLHITNNDEPIHDFEVNHEKLLHLIIVSKDLSYFNHVHPEYKGKGVFEIENEFPAGGEYRMVADFKPSDGSSMSKMTWIDVEGKTNQPAAVAVDNHLEKSVDGKTVKLSVDPQLEAGKELTLKFTLTDESTNQPISDLEPYLGSIGHVVIFSEDGERYLHVHAVDDQGSGPEALFETTFPESGVYKIWGQFQKDGEVFTVPFVIQVP